MPESRPMVNLKANRIPEARKLLPFVYEPWSLTLKKALYVDFRQLEILFLRVGITHVEDAFGDLLAGRCLSTPFCALDKNGTRSL